MIEITIVSMYNGRYHTTVIKRAERLCQLAVDGEVVYDDEEYAHHKKRLLEEAKKKNK